MAVILGGCVTAPVDLTPAKADFPGKTTADVRAKAIARCIGKGYTVDQSSENLVVCSKLAQDGKERLAALQAMGFPAVSGPIYVKIQCTAFQTDAGTTATLNEWLEAENAFGKKLKTQIGGSNNRGMLQNALAEMGGQ